jgi:hypothetical protein
MNRMLCVSLLCVLLSACSVGQRGQVSQTNSTKKAEPSGTSRSPLPKVEDTFAGGKVPRVEKEQAGGTPRAETVSGLPAPKTSVSLQTKYTKAIPLGDGRFAYETVQQWVFQLEGDSDGSRICVEDGSHCIELAKLKEQLSRPLNVSVGKH